MTWVGKGSGTGTPIEKFYLTLYQYIVNFFNSYSRGTPIKNSKKKLQKIRMKIAQKRKNSQKSYHPPI